MNVLPTAIPDVLVVEPVVHRDGRGFFLESFNERDFCRSIGRTVSFVQDNHSYSTRHVLRGLHYQVQRLQGKLVRVSRGTIFDVAVDLRQASPTFGHWVGEVLSAENARQLWIPEGFAHGFLVLSDEADVLYKTTDYWSPGDERCIAWDDPDLAIEWPLGGAQPKCSPKDVRGAQLVEAEPIVIPENTLGPF
jgi:dTDP-4-dehydrorhamnose 3,5-epimerase